MKCILYTVQCALELYSAAAKYGHDLHFQAGNFFDHTFLFQAEFTWPLLHMHTTRTLFVFSVAFLEPTFSRTNSLLAIIKLMSVCITLLLGNSE